MFQTVAIMHSAATGCNIAHTSNVVSKPRSCTESVFYVACSKRHGSNDLISSVADLFVPLFDTMADEPSKKRCFVPRTSRSDVWQWFVKQSPGSDGKQTAKCKECGKQYAFHGGTSNLLEHLKRKHPTVLSRCSAVTAVKTEVGTLSSPSTPGTKTKQVPLLSFVQSTTPTSSKPVSVARSNALDERLLAWLIEDLRPISTVSCSGFRRFMSFAEPGYVVPSRTLLSKQLKRRHEEGLKSLTKKLNDPRIQGLGLTTDIWTSSSAEAYNTITCHYVDQRNGSCFQACWKPLPSQGHTLESESRTI